MKTSKNKTAKVRIYVDLFFFILMILVLIPQSTGIPIHEWGSFIILLPFFLHLIINWKWITKNSSKILKKESNNTRFDYIFNWILYLFMLVITVSGIVISESVLPLFGAYFEPNTFWTQIHNASATLFMVLLGIHIALHWKWIVTSLKKFHFKSDFYNLIEIKTIIVKQTKQLWFLLAISVVLSVMIWLLDYSSWAENARINSPKEPRKIPDSWIIYVLPLVKVTVLMTIPALFTGGIIALKKYRAKKKK